MNTFQTDTVQDGLVSNDPAQELADAGMTLDTGHECGLSLHQLLMIDRHAQSLHNQNAAWMLRAELIAYDGCYD